MSDQDSDEFPSWEEFQDELTLLRAQFEGLEHILIGQYQLQPGNWQRNFRMFLGFFDSSVDHVLDHMRTQQGVMQMYLEHIETIEGAGHAQTQQ